MTDRDARLLYAAGFLDGEGSVGIYRDGHRTTRQGEPRPSRGLSWTAVLQASGYVRAPLDAMQAAFGGTISSGPTQNHSHTVFHWKLNRQVAVEGALRGLLPFLKVKQGQAELALRFLVWRRSAPHVFGPWEAAEAASFEEAMKEAKQEVL